MVLVLLVDIQPDDTLKVWHYCHKRLMLVVYRRILDPRKYQPRIVAQCFLPRLRYWLVGLLKSVRALICIAGLKEPRHCFGLRP